MPGVLQDEVGGDNEMEGAVADGMVLPAWIEREGGQSGERHRLRSKLSPNDGPTHISAVIARD